MKIYSTSFAIRETCVKTTMRDHYTPIRMAKIKISKTPNTGEHA